ncbi:MAG: radical SAM family heme chaperone HemW [Clostridia bacterium]|nr:radical SAM family heme chaperone HemW [Clostridia bacterium]
MTKMNTVGLYIHVPFCRHKCIYCGFYSVPCGEQFSLAEKYLEMLEKECKIKSRKYGKLSLDTIFVGGGTPSLLSPDNLRTLGRIIHTYFDLTNLTEFTFESNPGTLDAEKLKTMREIGANRLSMGLQSSSDETLSLIGRIHNKATFEESYKLVREAGFDNVSVDMIFGFPNQTLEDVKQDIGYLTSLKPEHISAYSLMIDEGTMLEQMLDDGKVTLPPEDVERQMYYAYREMLSNAGYVQYEISNWAQPGRQSQHNARYWRDKDYIGIGPSAHSLMLGERFGNPDSLDTWSESLANDQDPGILQEKRSIDDHMTEYMFTGLRMLEGISLEGFQSTFGQSIDEAYPGIVDSLIERGLLAKENGYIHLTDKGLDLGNQVFVEFVR